MFNVVQLHKTPSPEIGTVKKRRNRGTTYVERGSRDYLTPDEMDRLLVAARDNRQGHRDHTMLLVWYRHGLRSCEVCNLRWSQIDFKTGHIHVKRAKGSLDGVHKLQGDELRALKRLHRETEHHDYVFTSERGTPFSEAGVQKMVRRLAVKAELGVSVHSHMVRHGCGYALINKGRDVREIQDWMGHAEVSNTVRYTALNASRLDHIWD